MDIASKTEKLSDELYDILCQCCSGEALQVIRTVTEMQGWEAWSKLHRKYQPRSMARAIRLVGLVTNPPKVNDLKDVETALDKWEENVKTLQVDFKEMFSDMMKVGIVVSLLPTAIKDVVFQTVGETVAYEDVI